MDTCGPELEQRPAAGDGEAGGAGAERGVQRQVQAQVGGVERDVQPVADGVAAVDGGTPRRARTVCLVACRRQSTVSKVPLLPSACTDTNASEP